MMGCLTIRELLIFFEGGRDFGDPGDQALGYEIIHHQYANHFPWVLGMKKWAPGPE